MWAFAPLQIEMGQAVIQMFMQICFKNININMPILQSNYGNYQNAVRDKGEKETTNGCKNE